MQGQWKDTKKHFLKDKAKGVYCRHRKGKISEKAANEVYYADFGCEDSCEFLYKEVMDWYFFKRFYSMWNMANKKRYRQTVNQLARKKSKEWCSRISSDLEVYYEEASPKNFRSEKSIKWDVY